MKKSFLFFTLLFSVASLAQTDPEHSSISLSLVMPENFESLSEQQLSQLETKITQVISGAGISSTGYENAFVIYPKFEVVDTNVVEGGMQNITTVSVDVSLFIKQVENNVLFSTITKTVNGSGNSKQQALSNAISKISTNDADLQKFIYAAKSQIVNYYNSNCTAILNTAENLAKFDEFERAIGLLMSVPPEAKNCYPTMQSKAVSLYKNFQSTQCKKFIQEANLALLAKDYASLFNSLVKIDPSSPCFNESKEIAKKAENHLAREENKQWNFLMKQYNDQISLKKAQINAIKDIAVQYYKSRQNNIQYNVIVK